MKIFFMLSLLLSLLENTSAQNITETPSSPIKKSMITNDSSPTQYSINFKSETPVKDCYGIFFEYIYIGYSSVTVTGKFYNEPFELTFDLTDESDSSLVKKDTLVNFVPKSITINPNTKDITIKFDLYCHILINLYNRLSLTEQTSIKEYFKDILKRGINQEEYFLPINDDLSIFLTNYFKKLPIIIIKFNKGQRDTYTLSIDNPFIDPDDFGHTDARSYEE